MLQMTLDAIGDFAERELPEKLLIELDERDEFPADVVRRMCSDDLGVQLLFIPEDTGAWAARRRRLSRLRVHGPHRPGCRHVGAGDIPGSDPIVVGGTPEQQALWLGRIASEGLLMATARPSRKRAATSAPSRPSPSR